MISLMIYDMSIHDRYVARLRRIRIPMAPGVDSLNVGVAVGILLHETLRARKTQLWAWFFYGFSMFFYGFSINFPCFPWFF